MVLCAKSFCLGASGVMRKAIKPWLEGMREPSPKSVTSVADGVGEVEEVRKAKMSGQDCGPGRVGGR